MSAAAAAPASAASPRGRLTPAGRSATAARQGRLGFAFAPRFFVLWAAGLAWLLPALWRPAWAWALPAWSGALLLLWTLDLARLPAARNLSLERSWPAALALAEAGEARLRVENRARTRLRVWITDEIPAAVSGEEGFDAVTAGLRLEPGGRAEARLRVQPTRRGRQRVGDVYLKYRGGWELAEGWARAPMAEEVIVYPAAWLGQRDELSAARSRMAALQRRATRRAGNGSEFHHLREFRDGDEYRDINWRASARRGTLLAQVRRVERSQTLWIVLDCGRLLRGRVRAPARMTADPATSTLLRAHGLSKLDYAVSAALSLAETALRLGDTVGMLAYGHRTQSHVPPAAGPAQLRALIERMALATAEAGEADHHAAAARLMTLQKRRSLVLWITELAETCFTPEAIEAASHLTRRHLLLLAAVRQADLSAIANHPPRDAHGLYVAAAGRQLQLQREILLAHLRRHGALTLEMEPQGLAAAVVNRYLEIKERGGI